MAVNAWFCLLSPSGPSDLVLKTRKQGSSAAFIAVVASVILAIASLAALTGWLIYCRRYSQRIAQQAHRCPAGSIRLEAIFSDVLLGAVTSNNSLKLSCHSSGSFTGSTHFYEDVNSMGSDGESCVTLCSPASVTYFPLFTTSLFISQILHSNKTTLYTM